MDPENTPIAALNYNVLSSYGFFFQLLKQSFSFLVVQLNILMSSASHCPINKFAITSLLLQPSSSGLNIMLIAYVSTTLICGVLSSPANYHFVYTFHTLNPTSFFSDAEKSIQKSWYCGINSGDSHSMYSMYWPAMILWNPFGWKWELLTANNHWLIYHPATELWSTKSELESKVWGICIAIVDSFACAACQLLDKHCQAQCICLLHKGLQIAL